MSIDTVADCLFCGIVAGRIEAEKLYEDDRVLAFKDINPQAPVHGLIIPKTHISTLDELPQEDAELAGHLLLVAQQIAAAEKLPGYRVAMNVNAEGGQIIFHMHLHLLGGRQMSHQLG